MRDEFNFLSKWGKFFCVTEFLKFGSFFWSTKGTKDHDGHEEYREREEYREHEGHKGPRWAQRIQWNTKNTMDHNGHKEYNVQAAMGREDCSWR